MDNRKTEMERSEIYDRYARKRDELGYKNAQVARLAGIGQYDLTKWKKGEYMPGAKKLLAICEVLGIDLKWLLNGGELGHEDTQEFMNEKALTVQQQTDAPSLYSNQQMEINNYKEGTVVQGNSLQNAPGSIQQKRIAGSDVEEMKKVEEMEKTEKTEKTDDPFYRETIEALKRLSPVKRNLIIALIAACAEETP